MANQNRGEVTFDAKGKTWTLQFTTNAMCEVEDAFEKSIVEVANDLQSEAGVKIKSIRTLFKIGIGGCDSVEQAGDLMDAVGIQAAGELLGKAFSAAFPDADGEGGGKPKATGG